jgi:hypothetical protein
MWLLWIWVGGVVAQAVLLMSLDHSVDMLARIFHKRIWAPLVMLIIAVITWPLGIIGLLVPARVGRKLVAAVVPDSSGQDIVHCQICGYRGELNTWYDSATREWSKLPIGWWTTDDYELVCSKACAQSFALREHLRHSARPELH